MKCYYRTCLILGALFLAGVQNVHGQNWAQLTLPTPNYNQVEPYFLNEYVGFIFDPSMITPAQLYSTSDGGNSWTYLPFFDSIQVTIQQLYFESLTKGYAAASNGVYETENTGKTWRKIYKDEVPFNSVYAYNPIVMQHASPIESPKILMSEKVLFLFRLRNPNLRS